MNGKMIESSAYEVFVLGGAVCHCQSLHLGVVHDYWDIEMLLI